MTNHRPETESNRAVSSVRLGSIVLCGGRSSRMGVAKSWLPFGEELMLQRVVRIVSTVVPTVVVVAAPNQDLPPLSPQVQIVRDDREGLGPLNGLSAGLAAITNFADVVFATSCDVPLLKTEFVQALFAALRDDDVAVPVDGEFHHPLAAVYRVSVLSHVRELLAANELRPRRLFERVATRRIPVESLRVVDAELDSLANLNQPSDYLAALAHEHLPIPPGLPSNFYRQ